MKKGKVAKVKMSKETLESVKRGIEQSAAGKTRSLGSFAEFATDDGTRVEEMKKEKAQEES
jgi:hypothetical protein